MSTPEGQSTFFEGRVFKRRLPSYTARPPEGAPVLKRLTLPQGELAHFWNGEEPIRYIAYLELRDGTARGNHYHVRKREFLYLISGAVSVVVQEPGSLRTERFRLEPGELALIDAGIAHVYRVTRTGEAIEFSSTPFDAADVHPWKFEG